MKLAGILLFLITGITHSALTIAATEDGSRTGTVSGNKIYTIPDWFKESFLEIKEDVKEASEKNKHIMLFMHLDGCPYCSRMLDENFRRGARKSRIQADFDVIAINIKGDREIAWDDATKFTEKSLAAELKVRYTPTIVFLNSDGNKVLQLNGYRDPRAFDQVLNYVSGKYYYKYKLADYIRQFEKPLYSFIDEPQFKNIDDFSTIKTPLAIIFESVQCADCNEFHKKVLRHADVQQELSQYTVARLDASSTRPIRDITGNRTTPAAWAKKLKIEYQPATILFNEGEEVSRADGRLYHFHYKELLRYVSGAFNYQYVNYNQYLRYRQQELLQSGVSIDFSE